MTSLAVCDTCARTVRLRPDGRTVRHDTAGVLVRARTGKRRRTCKGSGHWPRRTDP